MSGHKNYIVTKTLEAFERFEPVVEETLPVEPGSPSVAPDGVPVFDLDTMRALELHKAKVINAPDFEAFMDLLQNIATEENLNPAQDFDKLASVLNRFRIDEGLEPL